MKNDQILAQISEFCRNADMAESTFGRRAVNDGKLVARLREGKRITIDTLERIQAYIAAALPGGMPLPRPLDVAPERRDPRGNFRFFENRQKYLLFVHTCSEKRVSCGAGRAGAFGDPSPAAGASGIRCRLRRRHGAGAGDALHAQPFSPYAVLYRGQGAQP